MALNRTHFRRRLCLDYEGTLHSLILYVERTTDFLLRATGRSGDTVTRTRTVTLDETQGAPVIGSFTGPSMVSPDELGRAEVTLGWEGVLRAEQLRIEADTLETIEIDSTQLEAGEVVVEIEEDTTFTLVATNEVGTAEASWTVEVVPLEIESFVADRDWVGLGDRVELSWITHGAAAVMILVDGVEIDLDEALETTGSHVLHPAVSSTIELRATSSAGQTVSAFVELVVDLPAILSFDVSPESSSLWASSPVVMSWTSGGGTGVRISNSGETLFSSEDPEVVDGSTFEWIAVPGSHELSLQVSNGTGVVSEVWQVEVAEGPTIVSFSVFPEEVNLGEEAALRWEVLPDPDGQAPTLVLEDQHGNTYATSGPAAELPITPDAAGVYDFELVATTNHERSIPAEATARLVVHGLPDVTLTATPNVFDKEIHEGIELSWTSENASSVVLYRLDGEAEIELYRVSEDELAAGSFVAEPPLEETTYRIVATNPMGVKEQAEATVAIAPLEIVSFTVEPDVAEPGQPVHLSWTTKMADSVSLSIFEQTYLLEETRLPYIDAEAEGGTQLPLTIDCTPAGQSLAYHSCAELIFPSGFSFPYGDARHSSARIYSNGYLSFTPSVLDQFGYENEANWPGWEGPQHIFPFWDTLTFDEELYPVGNIHYLHRTGPEGDHLVIQWKSMKNARYEYLPPTWEPVGESNGNLNFEVILWASGDFEFRYGTMDGGSFKPGWPTGLEDGGSATIGWRAMNEGETEFNVINYRDDDEVDEARVYGPLEGRSFRYRVAPPLATSGGLTWYPYASDETVAIRLRAEGQGESIEEEVRVSLVPQPTLKLTHRPPEALPVGEPFRIGWSTTLLTALEVVDGNGTQLCRAENQAEVENGFCDFVAPKMGVHQYRLIQTGARGTKLERLVEVTTYEPFGIESFAADGTIVPKGGSVTLSWVVDKVANLSLDANGTQLNPSWQPTGPGSFTVPSLIENTTFTLTVENSIGLKFMKRVRVEVEPISLSLSPQAATIRPGDSLTIDVSITNNDGGPPPPVYFSRELQPSATAYSDISKLPQAVNPVLTSVDWDVISVDLPTGFVFPYFGDEFTSLQVFADGYISFTSKDVLEQNVRLPNSTGKNGGVHLAPFWDDLLDFMPSHGNSELWVAQIGDSFVVQWTKMSLAAGSTDHLHDLNFQVVLFEDGSFEFRYGDMKGLPAGQTSSECTPNTCENEANGSSATIGYQRVGSSMGSTFHFGSGQPVPGGLGNRSLRFEPLRGSGQVVLHPTATTSVLFCAGAGHDLCKTVEIDVPFGIDEFEVSAPSIELGGHAELSWKTAGGRSLTILANGTEIHSENDPALVDSGTLRVQPTVSTIYELLLVGTDNADDAFTAIDVVPFRVTASASGSEAFPGDPITLDWSITNLDPSVTPILITPMTELASSGFGSYAIRADTGATRLIGAGADNTLVDHTFDGGFAFDYFGVTMNEVKVSTDGYLSFSSSATTSLGANQALPNASGNNRQVHLAPFWDDLHTRANGEVLAKAVDADTYVIQWSGMSLKAGTSDSNQGNLNFLVVLRRNGAFEFHYDAMLPQPIEVAGNECFPRSCVNESNGAAATIGYQLPSGKAGALIHFGGTTPAPTQHPVAGGLAGRSWRFEVRNAGGSLEVRPTDSRFYEICALDPATDTVACATPIHVSVPWGVRSFTGPASVSPGSVVRLGWEVAGLEHLEVRAGETVIYSAFDPVPSSDSVEHMPTETTEYTLEAFSLGRRVVLTKRVQVRTFDLSIRGPADRIMPGDTVTVEWDLTALAAGASWLTTPMYEIPAGPGEPGEYKDISVLEGAQELSRTGSASGGYFDIVFPFEFNYFGSKVAGARAYVDGYLSFSFSGSTGRSRNSPLPSAPEDASVHLAPFWDDLTMRGPEKLWVYQPDLDTFIIQWTAFNLLAGSSASVHGDLNFQVVLFADGSFEYRYGRMAPPPYPHTFSGCFPSDCEGEANGSNATIGYQSLNREGHTWHFGIGYGEGGKPVEGGLSGRALRYSPETTGSTRIKVDESRDLTICAGVGSFSDCHSIRLETAADPGDLAITELMILPEGGASEQWFEVRNLSNRVIDLKDFEIATSSHRHTIDRSLLVASGEFVTLAASIDVGFTPDYVYGTGLPFSGKLDKVELVAGDASVASASWGSSWFLPEGRTVSLDPSKHKQGTAAHNDFRHWCVADAATPGALGVGCLNPYYDIDSASTLPFYDISLTGTRLPALETFNGYAKIPAPGFSMPVFGEVRDAVWAGSKGVFSFVEPAENAGTYGAPNVGQFPRSSAPQLPAPLVGAYWDHLVCNRDLFECSFTWQHGVFGGNEMLILQWTGFKRGTSLTANVPGTATFQAQLWKDGTIVIAFADMVPEVPTWSFQGQYYLGSVAFVGIEGMGAQYIAHHGDGFYDFNSKAFRISPK